MVHDYHEGLPGHSPAQILHDGCAECEARAGEAAGGIAHLDKRNFARAWARAADWNKSCLSYLSRAEIPMLTALWTIQLKLEQFGCEIGTVPCA